MSEPTEEEYRAAGAITNPHSDPENLAREMREELRVCRTPQEQEKVILAALQRAVDLWKSQAEFESEHREKYRQRSIELTAQLAELKSAFDDRVRVIELQLEDKRRLTAQLAAAKADTERLDYVERAHEIRHSKHGWAVLPAMTNYEYDLHPSLREAIDFCRKELK